MSIKAKSLISGFVFSIIFSLIKFSGNCDSISNKIFRLHIIANSDSAVDQALKLKVRDRLLNEFGDDFLDANDVISAKKLAEENLDKIQNVAQDEISRNGFNYSVSAVVCHMLFGTRHYGNVTMPAGYYDALRISIGDASGKNWWCVMFPPMCLPAAECENEIEKALDNPELSVVASGQKYVLEFKIVDVYFKVKEFLNEFVCKPVREFFGFSEMPYQTSFAFLELFNF